MANEVQVNQHLDIALNEIRNMLVHKLGSDPTVEEARLAYHTGRKVLIFQTDTTTIDLGPLDKITAPGADVSLNSHKITNLLDPTSAQDAATKAYADMLRQGIADTIHDPVRVAVSSNVTISSPGSTLNGVTISGGDANKRVLLYGQTTTTENGIYDWNGAASAMTRSSDANATGEVVDGSLVATQEGTSPTGGWLFIQTATPSGAPGAWSQVWTQYQSGSTYSADGTTIQLTGSTFSLIAPVAIASGGTNATTAAGARANLGALTSLEFTVGDGSNSFFDLTHNFNTRAVDAHIYRNSSPYDKIIAGVEALDVNTTRVRFSPTPSTNQWKVLLEAKA